MTERQVCFLFSFGEFCDCCFCSIMGLLVDQKISPIRHHSYPPALRLDSGKHSSSFSTVVSEIVDARDNYLG